MPNKTQFNSLVLRRYNCPFGYDKLNLCTIRPSDKCVTCTQKKLSFCSLPRSLPPSLSASLLPFTSLCLPFHFPPPSFHLPSTSSLPSSPHSFCPSPPSLPLHSLHSAPPAPHPKAGWRTHSCWTETSQGTRQSLSMHVPWGGRRVCLPLWLWVSSSPQHISS